jgi:acetyltransferase-like isoleucine patch superfamily enzyme
MKEEARVSKNAKLDKSVKIEAPVTLYGTAFVKKNSSIGMYSFINSNTTVYPDTVIGRYCSIGKNCEIGAFDHPIDWLSTSPFQYNMQLHFPQHQGECHQIKPSRPNLTTIGNDVWIGSLCIIKRGITIGDGAIIAGGAVVIDDVPPYAIVGGIPAKVLKYRFDETKIEKLKNLKWWELLPTQLEKVSFNDIDKALSQIEEIKNNLERLLNKK